MPSWTRSPKLLRVNLSESELAGILEFPEFLAAFIRRIFLNSANSQTLKILLQTIYHITFYLFGRISNPINPKIPRIQMLTIFSQESGLFLEHKHPIFS